jgi:hypothetical protein
MSFFYFLRKKSFSQREKSLLLYYNFQKNENILFFYFDNRFVYPIATGSN